MKFSGDFFREIFPQPDPSAFIARMMPGAMPDRQPAQIS
jgi:hypothetical protein